MPDVLITAQPQAREVEGKRSPLHLKEVEPEANAIKTAFGVRADLQSRISVGSLNTLLAGKRIWFFPGHGDAMQQGEPVPLFEDQGSFEAVSIDSLVSIVRPHVVEGGLQLIVFTGCRTESLGAALCERARVPHVICWETELESKAAEIFGKAFAEDIADQPTNALDPGKAFEAAKSAVLTTVEDGSLDTGHPGKVQKYEFVDPFDASLVNDPRDKSIAKELRGRIRTPEGAPRGRIAAGRPLHLRPSTPVTPAATPAESSLREDLDTLARAAQPFKPTLTLIEPSQEHQTRVRKVARTRGVSMDAMEEADAPVSTRAPTSSTPRTWTSVESGEKLLLECSGLVSGGFCYLFHLNEDCQLSLMFPSKLDGDNAVGEVGKLTVPRCAKRYLAFDTPKGTEIETFYLLTSSRRLEGLLGVGTLPDDWTKLPASTAQAILAALRRHTASVTAPSVPPTRGMDMVPMIETMDVSDTDQAGVRMGFSRLVLISVAKDI
jgi:hypothetical protein